MTLREDLTQGSFSTWATISSQPAQHHLLNQLQRDITSTQGSQTFFVAIDLYNVPQIQGGEN